VKTSIQYELSPAWKARGMTGHVYAVRSIMPVCRTIEGLKPLSRWYVVCDQRAMIVSEPTRTYRGPLTVLAYGRTLHEAVDRYYHHTLPILDATAREGQHHRFTDDVKCAECGAYPCVCFQEA
jgi:hypothetical protein